MTEDLTQKIHDIVSQKRAEPGEVIPQGAVMIKEQERIYLLNPEFIAAEVERLVGEGADPAQPDEYGSTVLHKAAGNGLSKVCDFLLSQKIKVNALNDLEQTPLDLAKNYGHEEICEKLINHEAKPGKAPIVTKSVFSGRSPSPYWEGSKS